MLEFVHVSGPSGSQDVQTRRKVRSQAMRDFRRRQREERELLKGGISRQASPSIPERERAASTASESTQPLSRRLSRRDKSPVPAHLASQKEGERTLQTKKAAPTPLIRIDMSNQESLDQWQYDLGAVSLQAESYMPYWEPQYSSREPSPSMLQEPSMWGTNPQDPFENPAQLQQMLAFCRSYIHWLRPGVRTQVAQTVIGDAWEARPCPMLLAACCLASVGHLDAVQPDRPGGNYEVYKARVLRDVSRRMKSPATALSDEVIGALACLLSFELSRGSKEALTHLYGLRSLLGAKGGVEGLEARPLATMLQTLDLLHAVLFETVPVLTNTIEDVSLFASAEDLDGQPERLTKASTAILHEFDNFIETEPAGHADAVRSLRDLKHEVALILRDEIEDASGTSPSSTRHPAGDIGRYRRALEEFARARCPERTEPEAFHFVRCQYYMILIHFNTSARRKAYRSAANQALVASLFDAFQRVRSSTWEPVPYMRLFVLLTGAATTTDASMRSFFKAELIRSIYALGAEETPRVEAFILRFIKTRDLLQRSERLASAVDVDASAEVRSEQFDPAAEQGYFDMRGTATTSASTGYAAGWSRQPGIRTSYPASAPVGPINPLLEEDEEDAVDFYPLE